MLRRLFPILCLCLLIAPGHWLRTPISSAPGASVTLHDVPDAPSNPELPAGWSMEGIWEIRSSDPTFGGFSALLALDDGSFLGFSDRGRGMAFSEPGTPGTAFKGMLGYVQVDPAYRQELWDIESATRDPETGRIWLGFENTHAIHRFEVNGGVGPVSIIDKEVDWSVNSGAEAMVRLADGRFVVIPESGGEALVYPSDPTMGAKAEAIEFVSPLPGFGITDAVQLPDGRLLILMRNLVWGMPPFEARIAIAELEEPSKLTAIAPQIALDLTATVPADNYEGLVVRERMDGALDVWVLSDDNLSAFQRTLLVKLRFDPSDAAPTEGEDEPAPRTKQKARE